MVFKTSLDKLTGFRDVSHAKEKGRNPSLGSDGCGVFDSGVNKIAWGLNKLGIILGNKITKFKVGKNCQQ